MTKDLEQRTKRFALAAIKLVASLPRGAASDVLERQLLRSATSIGAYVRIIEKQTRAVSRPDFTNKIGTIQKEADETQYWLEYSLNPS